MVTSYKQLIKFVDDFASQHQQIQRFRAEFEEQMPNFATENEAYPILFMAPVGSQFFFNQDTYTVRFYCFDIIQKDRANINYILSDTNLILNDLKKWFQDGTNYTFDILGDPTATPINNALLDYAAGWQMDITFNVDTYCVDEIPFKDSPLIPVEGYDVVYSRYLTCETVTGCTTLQDYVQNEIENFTGFTGGGDLYWVSGSTGFFSVKAKNDSGLDAVNDYSLAEGFATRAQGYSSHAEGQYTTAGGQASHAEGDTTRASGQASHSEGTETTASGSYSHAEGYLTTASGQVSHAEGEGTIASARRAHAEGLQTIASGDTSHAEGLQTTASGNYSHAEGQGTIANGVASHSEGTGTIAQGNYSHAGGEKTLAKGQNSFVHGYNSVANGNSTIVLGDNIDGVDSNTVYIPNLYIKEINSGHTNNSIYIDENGLLTKSNGFDFSLNFISDFTYPIILPYNWLVESVDNPSSIGYSLSTSAGTYTLSTNLSAFTETLTVSASTSGFINLICRRIN